MERPWSVGERVVLTEGEVQHARAYPHVALYVVAGITLDWTATGEPIARGGTVSRWPQWRIDDGRLAGISFMYAPPGAGRDSHYGAVWVRRMAILAT